MHRGWLGVRIQQVTDDIALSLGLKSAKGALIAGVTPNGPAAKGGIINGDLVLAFDSKPVADSRALPRMVADEPVGKTVPMEVWRKGARKTVQVTLGRLQDVAGTANGGEGQDERTLVKPQPSKAQTPVPKRPASRLGAVMSPLTPQLRSHYHIGNNVQGVVVTDVDDDSPAADKNIVPGDVIVEVAQEPVKTPGEVAAKLEAAAKAARNVVLLLVSRGGELTFVAVNLART